jgi:hypothetical protein
VDLLKQVLQLFFQFFILCPGIKFANEMSPSLKNIGAELQSSMAKVLDDRLAKKSIMD